MHFYQHYSGLKVSRGGEVMWTTTYKTGHQHIWRTYGCLRPDGHRFVGYKGKVYPVHKLVAEVFLNSNQPLSEGYVVHHIDENPANNIPENLKILTREEHMSLHHTGKLVSEETRRNLSKSLKGKLTGEKHPRYGKFGTESPTSKPVIGINKTTGEKVTFSCAVEAYRKLKIAFQSISACCKGRKKTAGGYYWHYA